MANRIDLRELPLWDTCELFSLRDIQAKVNNDRIQLRLKLLDFVDTDVTGLFIEGLYRTIYFF